MFDEIRNWGRLSDIVTATLTEIISFKMTLTKLTMWNSMEVLSTQLILVRHTDPRSWVLSRRSYRQWQSMGAILIVDGPRLARVFFGTRLPGSGSWVGLAGQGVAGVCCYSLQGGVDPGSLAWWRGGPSAVLRLPGVAAV